MTRHLEGSNRLDTEEDKARFAEWFRGLRERSGLTQKDVAKRAGAARSTVSAIENGKAEAVSAQMVKRLGVAVGGTETEALIAGGFIALEGLTLESLEWARDLERLPEDLRQVALAVVREAKIVARKRIE